MKFNFIKKLFKRKDIAKKVKSKAKNIESEIKNIEKKVVSAIDSDELKKQAQKQLRSTLIKKTNKKIDLPFLNEEQEAVLIGLAIDIIAGLAKKAVSK